MPNKQQQPSADVAYDSKGRCIYHPKIRLRKRSTLKRNWITINKQCPSCLAELLSSSSYNDDIDNKTSHTRRRPQQQICPPNIIPPCSVHDDDKARQPHHDNDEEGGGGGEEEDDEYEDFECSSSTLTTAEETISSYSSASLSSSLSSLDGSHNAAHYATDYDDNTDNDNQGPQRTKVVCGMPYVYYSYVRCSPQEYCNQGGGGEGGGGNVYQEQQEYEQYGFYTGEIDAITSRPHGLGSWRCSNGPNNGEGRRGGGTTLLEGSWFDGHLYTQSNSPQSQQQQQQQRRLTPIMEHSLFYDDEEEEPCLMYDNNEGIGMSLDDGEPIYNNNEISSSSLRRTKRSADPPSSLEGTYRIISGERDNGGGVGSSSNNERGTNENISSLSLCAPCRI